MARQKFSNHAFSTLAGNILVGDLSLSVQAGDGALFPSLSGGDWFICTLIDSSNNKEIVKVTARSTDDFTIVRAQEGTTARAYTSGDRVALRVTANALTLLAPLADPTFTGTVTVPTPADPADDTTKTATTAWINAAISTAIAAIPADFVVDYIKVSEVQAANTAGGTFTAGSWQTRVLNTEDSDTGGHASVASNQITLAAGTYTCRIRAPALRVNHHKARLYNITGAATLLLGTSEFNEPAAAAAQTCSEVTGKIVLAAPTVVEVQHVCDSTFATDGFGVANNLGVNEVYTVAEFWKVA